MPQDNLLSLFDNIEVNNVARISDSDKSYCEALQEDFNKVYAQIAAWRKHILSFEDPYPNPIVKVTSRASVFKDIPYTPGKRNGYNVLGFSPLYALKGCTDQLFSLCERFENEIISHFNSDYGCQFKSRHLLISKVFGKTVDNNYSKPEFVYDCRTLPFPEDNAPIPSYESVIDYIIEDMDGKSFKQIAKDIAYDWIWQNISRYERIVLTISKNKVKIPSFVYYNDWRNELTYESEPRLYNLLNAIHKHFDWPTDATYKSDTTYGIEYPIRNSPCTSYKGYKNGTLELMFSTAEQAQSFQQLCESLKKRTA